jgi:hypothetical protein
MVRAVRGLEAARRATVFVCDKEGAHKGQGLMLDLEGEGAVVLMCHHIVSPMKEDDLRVRIPTPRGSLGEPIQGRYDRERSRPERDAVALRVDEARRHERPLLHKLSLDKYNGSLQATILTYLQPNNFNAEVRPSTGLKVEAKGGVWPDSPERYELQAFRLRTADDARRGISGGVVLCEEGVLGLVHFARAEGPTTGREAFLVPLTVWAEAWPALESIRELLH